MFVLAKSTRKVITRTPTSFAGKQTLIWHQIRGKMETLLLKPSLHAKLVDVRNYLQ